MPWKAKSGCSTPGCSYLTWRDGKCKRHQRPSASQRGYGAHWTLIRAEHLQLEPYCRVCGAQATDVDHIVPKRAGGSENRQNLQSLCKQCHSAKTGRGL